LRQEKDNDDRIKILKGNMGWHADSTHMPVQAKGPVFCASRRPSAAAPAGPTCAPPTRRSTRRDARQGRRLSLPLPALQPVRLGHDTKKADGSTAGMASMESGTAQAPDQDPSQTSRKSLLIGRHALTFPAWTRPESYGARGPGRVRLPAAAHLPRLDAR
jgi:hypothetical protein